MGMLHQLPDVIRSQQAVAAIPAAISAFHQEKPLRVAFTENM
jgi:hypothetical protein